MASAPGARSGVLSAEEKMIMLCGSDFWRMRLVTHPKLGLSLSDVRDITFRESVVCHVFLDMVDAKGMEMANQISSSVSGG